MDALCNCKHLAVEQTLQNLQQKMATFGSRKEASIAPNTHARPSSAARRPKPHRSMIPSTRAEISPEAGHVRSDKYDVDGFQDLVAEKDANIRELRETVEILEIKIQKLEQLVKLKDSKISTLQAKLQQ